MHAWRRFWQLPAGDRVFVVEAACLMIAARFGMQLLPIERLRPLLARTCRPQRPATDGAGETNRHVAWAVGAVASRMPGKTSCLIDALAAEAMLRRRGYECQLRLGVPPAAFAKGRFAAHAWIEHDGHVVIGAVDGLHEYAVFSGPAKS